MRFGHSMTVIVGIMTALSGCMSAEEAALADTEQPYAEEPESIGSTAQAIVNGALAEPDDFGFGAVKIWGQRPDRFRPFCSGVMITSNVVATAHHCFTESGLAANQVIVQHQNQLAYGVQLTPIPGKDVTLLRIDRPIIPAGQPANFIRPSRSVVPPSSFIGRNMLCFGQAQVVNGAPAPGPMTAAWFNVFDASADAFVANAVPENAGITKGDSGGPCFEPNGGPFTSWPVVGLIVGGSALPFGRAGVIQAL